jgi:hypothetical protein
VLPLGNVDDGGGVAFLGEREIKSGDEHGGMLVEWDSWS